MNEKILSVYLPGDLYKGTYWNLKKALKADGYNIKTFHKIYKKDSGIIRSADFERMLNSLGCRCQEIDRECYYCMMKRLRGKNEHLTNPNKQIFGGRNGANKLYERNNKRMGGKDRASMVRRNEYDRKG